MIPGFHDPAMEDALNNPPRKQPLVTCANCGRNFLCVRLRYRIEGGGTAPSNDVLSPLVYARTLGQMAAATDDPLLRDQAEEFARLWSAHAKGCQPDAAQEAIQIHARQPPQLGEELPP